MYMVLQCSIIPRWCRISSINSSKPPTIAYSGSSLFFAWVFRGWIRRLTSCRQTWRMAAIEKANALRRETRQLNSVFNLPSTNELPLRIYLDGGFKHFLFSPLFGEDSDFDYHFSDGLKPPTSYGWKMKFAELKYFFWGGTCSFSGG